jgi:hypothetical protein
MITPRFFGVGEIKIGGSNRFRFKKGVNKLNIVIGAAQRTQREPCRIRGRFDYPFTASDADQGAGIKDDG